MEQKRQNYSSDKFKEITRYINDKSYVMGREITKVTDKIIPGKRERRDYALRTRINKLLDGELSDEELTKLGFQASGLKGGYAIAIGSLAAGCITLDPILFVLSAGAGGLGLLHQLAMSNKFKKTIGELSEEEREKLKNLLKDKDTYEFRDTLYQLYKF